MNKTVYVIGAGASEEVGMPTGNDLKQRIADLLNDNNPDDVIRSALQSHADKFSTGSMDDYSRAARMIRENMDKAISIDHFVHAHADDEAVVLCAKLAIVRSILKAEKISKLYENPSRAPENSWFPRFFKLITENCRKGSGLLEKRLHDSLVLVIFNYDRCIEHFLVHALKSYYDMEDPESHALVRGMQIYHPYGPVGYLPWYGGGSCVDFGAEHVQLLELSNEIRTVTEGADETTSKISEIRDHIRNANRLVFLGFAFHKLNMKLIGPGPPRPWPAPNCYATAHEMSESNAFAIKSRIRALCGTDDYSISMPQVKCFKLFDDYWEHLSFSGV